MNLLISISDLFEAKLNNNAYIEKNGYSVEVRLNEDNNEDKSKIFPDGFLCFPYCIEIDILDSIKEIEAAKEITKILTFLWENNYSAIASCDFEELLPENGGYKSKNIPWIT